MSNTRKHGNGRAFFFSINIVYVVVLLEIFPPSLSILQFFLFMCNFSLFSDTKSFCGYIFLFYIFMYIYIYMRFIEFPSPFNMHTLSLPPLSQYNYNTLSPSKKKKLQFIFILCHLKINKY